MDDCSEGMTVGFIVEGKSVGLFDGINVGFVGLIVGFGDGLDVGDLVGDRVGNLVGDRVGNLVGDREGLAEGAQVDGFIVE